jgi:GeoRSP system SPASM domain protein
MELASPITIYWDFALNERVEPSLQKICMDVLSARPLMLQLFDPSPSLGAGALSALEQLRGASLAVTLTVSAECLVTLDSEIVRTLGIRELLVTIEHPTMLANITSQLSFGVSCPVSRENWRELPALVTACRERGINRLVLPMQRLYVERSPFLLTKNEQGELEAMLAVVGGVNDLKLTIHDPFLWRAFNPSIPFPQGGCQAANTMIAISPDKGVYPCPTLPVRLGNLEDETLVEILASPQKKDFRRSLLSFPEACRSCAEVDICKGGCRGRTYVKHDSLDEIDEACQ